FMTLHRMGFAVGAALVVTLSGQDWRPAGANSVAAADVQRLSSARSPAEIAARIDHYLAAGWSTSKAEPAPVAEDGEFLRRVYLDIAGRIPSVAETRAFLQDSAPDKRRRLVDRLLDSPRYITHFVSVWRALLLPEVNT